jgi:hypothetical protein
MQPITELPSGMSSPYLRKLDKLMQSSEKADLDLGTGSNNYMLRVYGQDLTFN